MIVTGGLISLINPTNRFEKITPMMLESIDFEGFFRYLKANPMDRFYRLREEASKAARVT